MRICSISEADQDVFHGLLNAYYREGEDADTQQAEIDQFIDLLFSLCIDGSIRGAIAYADAPAGFVLYARDTEALAFSNWPGHGTILEIGVENPCRLQGYGGKLVAFAEDALRKEGETSMYVCAYGPAEHFWRKHGYSDTGRIADNGLKIYQKHI